MNSIETKILDRSQAYFGERAVRVEATGDVSVRHWSLLSRYTVETASGRQHAIYCKQPKSRRGIRTAAELAGDPLAESMAREEYAGLRLLSRAFADAPPALGVVRPLDLVGDVNAILTAEVPGSTDVFRRLRRLSGSRANRSAAGQMLGDCGRWIAHLHHRPAEPAETSPAAGFIDELDDYAAALAAFPHCGIARRVEHYLIRLRRAAGDEPGPRALTVEGVEVRNFLSNGRAVYFLDPGTIAAGSPYDDLARFLVSLRCLYWGCFRFPLGYAAAQEYAAAFLAGYEGACGPVDRGLLAQYLAKQTIRFWVAGLRVLAFKRWSRPRAMVIQRLYVEGPLRRALEECLSDLECPLAISDQRSAVSGQISFPAES